MTLRKLTAQPEQDLGSGNQYCRTCGHKEQNKCVENSICYRVIYINRQTALAVHLPHQLAGDCHSGLPASCDAQQVASQPASRRGTQFPEPAETSQLLTARTAQLQQPLS